MHSILADGEKYFQKLCFVLIRGILPTVLAVYCVLLTWIRLKMHFEFSFLKIYKRDKVLYTNDEAERILGLLLGRFFLVTYLIEFGLKMSIKKKSFRFCRQYLILNWYILTDIKYWEFAKAKCFCNSMEL